MADSFAEFSRRLDRLEDPATLRRIAQKAGVAGKKSALDAAAADLGGDRRFSHMRGRARLDAGYDELGASSVQINLRPAGLWILAQEGRRKTGPIVPRKRGGKKALRTPLGPRARSTYKPSRGLGTYDSAVRDAQRSVPRAAAQQFTQEVARVVR